MEGVLRTKEDVVYFYCCLISKILILRKSFVDWNYLKKLFTNIININIP
jgi:hypothetical protein